jgi:hypothetical protein
MRILHDPLTGQHLRFRRTGKQTGGQLLEAEVLPDRAAASLAICTVASTSGWRHASWLVEKPDGDPFYAVTEGAFNYLSTIDVGCEVVPVPVEVEVAVPA